MGPPPLQPMAFNKDDRELEEKKLLMFLDGLKLLIEMELAPFVRSNKIEVERLKDSLTLEEYLGSTLYHRHSVLSVVGDHLEYSTHYIDTIRSHIAGEEVPGMPTFEEVWEAIDGEK